MLSEAANALHDEIVANLRKHVTRMLSQGDESINSRVSRSEWDRFLCEIVALPARKRKSWRAIAICKDGRRCRVTFKRGLLRDKSGVYFPPHFNRIVKQCVHEECTGVVESLTPFARLREADNEARFQKPFAEHQALCHTVNHYRNKTVRVPKSVHGDR